MPFFRGYCGYSCEMEITMKIKTKLIISFCIIIFVPMLLAGALSFLFYNFQVQTIAQTYGIRNADAYSIANSVQIMMRYTTSNFEELKRIAKEDPQRLEDAEYLMEMNEDLKQKYSYLIVREEDILRFNGDMNNGIVLNSLPEYGSTGEKNGTSVYVDSKKEILIKQLDFLSAGKKPSSAFIVTSIQGTVPGVKKIMLQVILSVFLILLLTACMMIVWIYRSMITPIRKLQVAAENIKEGNLDFSMEVEGEDEIGELCVTFEEMRQRLKESA